DIDATGTAAWNDGEGFVPIGNDYATSSFEGNFDGLSHVIDGLTINRSSEDVVGLFGHVGLSNPNSEIKNIGLTNVNFTTDGWGGALVGAIFGGTVSNSYSTG